MARKMLHILGQRRMLHICRQRRKKDQRQFEGEKSQHAHTRADICRDGMWMCYWAVLHCTIRCNMYAPRWEATRMGWVLGAVLLEKLKGQQMCVCEQRGPYLLENLQFHTPKALSSSLLANVIPCDFKSILFAYFYCQVIFKNLVIFKITCHTFCSGLKAVCSHTDFE